MVATLFIFELRGRGLPDPGVLAAFSKLAPYNLEIIIITCKIRFVLLLMFVILSTYSQTAKLLDSSTTYFF